MTKGKAPFPSGPLHPRWAGDSVTYDGAHIRVRKARGSADHCEHCGSSDPARQYDWASISGNYTDIMDYKPLCRMCHAQFDREERYQRRSHCKRGHALTDDNVRLNKRGYRRCLKCYRDGALKWKRDNAEHRAAYRKAYLERTGK
jgi:hypothetical protein